jgi:hypothetical protein
MPTFTLAQIRTAIRELGDYPVSLVFSDSVVTRYVNEAIADLRRVVGTTYEGFYDTTSTVATAAGTQTVNLPSDFLSLRAIDRQLDSENFTPLDRLNFRDTYAYGGRGVPIGYMLHGGTAPGVVRLFPIPDAVYTIRFTYEPLFTQLVNDGDTFDFRNGWETYVHHSALLRMDAREEKPLGERLQLIERARQDILYEANNRNCAEPDYLTLHSEFVPWEYVP